MFWGYLYSFFLSLCLATFRVSPHGELSNNNNDNNVNNKLYYQNDKKVKIYNNTSIQKRVIFTQDN